MPTALCIAAYEPEVRALTELLFPAPAQPSAEQHGGVTYTVGDLNGLRIVLLQSGESLVNAAFTLQRALTDFDIDYVLFAGVAGGIDPNLGIGDVVVPETWAYHSEMIYANGAGDTYALPDYYTPPAGSPHFGFMFPDGTHVLVDGQVKPELRHSYPVDAGLLGVARTCSERLKLQRADGSLVKVECGGVGVSGTVFVDRREYREWLFNTWTARCADMESTALAHVCFARRKPVIVIRSLSDLAGGQHGGNPIDTHELPSARNAAALLRAMLEHLAAGLPGG